MQIHMLKICKKRKLEREREGGGEGGAEGEKEKISPKDSMSKDIKNAHK